MELLQVPPKRTYNSSFNFTEKKTNSKHSKTRVIKNHSEKDYKKAANTIKQRRNSGKDQTKRGDSGCDCRVFEY